MTDFTFGAIFDGVTAFVDAKITDKGRAERLRGMLARSKDAIGRQYDDVRELTKKSYMDDEKGRLDRHKCAACFIVACLNGLEIDEAEGANRLNREKLALFLGLTILRTFIRLGNKNHEDDGMVLFMERNGDRLIYPECIKDFNPHHHNWALELFYARQNGELSVLSIAHELFFIERYNRERCEIQRLAKNVAELEERVGELTAEKEDLTKKLAAVRTTPFQK